MPILKTKTANNSTAAPASFTDVVGLVETVTITSGSVVLLIANVPITFSGTDATADFQFADGGTVITNSPVLTCGFSDNTDEGAHGMICYALNGVSGSKTYSIQWKDRIGTVSTRPTTSVNDAGADKGNVNGDLTLDVDATTGVLQG